MDLGHFICPTTGAALRREGSALIGGARPYPILHDIPRFVASDNYAEAFGLQWNKFKRTQLDSATDTTITEDRLRIAFGCDLSELAGKRVLEAGSGAGRFTEILLKHGALVYSFDYSSAVEANFENNGSHDRLTLFQADIRHIPFANDTFDAVVCLGVLQHTPSTLASLTELTRVLKPGGQLVTDHYKWHLGNFTSLYLPWWAVIKRLSPARQIDVTDQLTKIFFPIHWSVRNNRLAQLLLRRVSPINFYYGDFDLPKDTLYEWSRLDTHDRNTDHFKRHVTRRSYQALLEQAKLTDIEVFVGGTGYVGRAIKAVASATNA
ncbi:SAM-dependent methyltransferase [Sphingomonas naasensis]|uniref:Class I SAM-dependent methyltransferase n=1 Tax=Sphingomonas naasensis TaxID=1344951 RepID=A0A4S1WVN9_9SPHN|nr:class I SAM-dependent methyltransferase [Sphingomonas naasensis]NIJ19302.1 SAM-dependent methyltransferase [Sphingomonas naasensis]TGX46477.1 class I SAM-dependent methyltransferase [Sphingomonas naasensis]